MRDKIPSFIIKMKVNMKICQYFVEIMICLPFCLKKLNLLKSGLHKDNLYLFLFFPFQDILHQFNSSHPSADCSCHSNLPSLFPAPTILVTKYKGFLCNLFLLWE